MGKINILLLIVLMVVGFNSGAQTKGNFSGQVATDFIQRFPNPDSIHWVGQSNHFSWQAGYVLFAMEKMWLATGDSIYFKYIKQYVDQQVDKYGNIPDFKNDALDNFLPGYAILFMYEHTKLEKYKIAATHIRNGFNGYPRAGNGLFWHASSDWARNQVWVDGVFMGQLFLARYGKVIGDSEYAFGEVVKQMTQILNKCRKENGLLLHGWNESKTAKWANKATGLAPEVWSEGLGWFAVLIADVFDYIPENQSGREELMGALQKLCDGLKNAQDPKTGMWCQVVDKCNEPGNWNETSGTGMFIYLIQKSIDKGYISKSAFKPVVDKAYQGIIKKAILNNQGHLDLIDCSSIGIQNSYADYISQPKEVSPFAAFGSFIIGTNSMESKLIKAEDEKNTNDVSVKGREHLLMDFGWRFALGHATDYAKDFSNGTGYFTYYTKTGYGDGAAAAQFEDRTWREVDLPHDWAVELPFSGSASHSHGYKTIGWKYPETSVGWYRKNFTIPASDLGRKINIQFDGVHRDSKVWVNGFFVGNEVSGYTSSVYDITDYLNYGGENVVAVRVDASIEEGWFYEGAGIYRHVWLNKTYRLHVAQYGTFVTSEINGSDADLTIRTTLENQNSKAADFSVEQTLFDADNKQVVSQKYENLSLKGNLNNTFSHKLKVENPTLWSIENPYLYCLETRIIAEGKTVDSYKTTIGIRTVRFDPNEGFFLNGKSVKIKGVNNHQDHAGVGTAIPDALQEFRVKKLKEMGNNAIRTSHNPPTPELLDICDRLGMLILDENRLMGINQEHFSLLKRFMVRDRNHPSVILWSLGNEEWAIEGNEKGARITKTMQEFAQKIDSSRAFTVAISGGWDNGSGRTAQVMGYNYIVQGNIDEHHKKFPWQSGIGTEESNTIGTRGVYVDDKVNGHMAASNRMPENVGTESGWQFYAARPFLAGLFYWTGFDYRGEPYPFGWPAVNSQFGIIDLCGFPKDIFYYLKSWWGNEPVMHIMPHWNWKGSEGKNIKINIYSNAEEVELILNKKSLGRKTMPKNGHLEWDVAYQPGILLAKGYVKGKATINQQVETTDVAAKVALSSERIQVNADGEDVAIITVQVNDQKNRMIPMANNEISFTLTGPGKIIGVGNGDPASHDPEQYIETVDKVNVSDLKFKLSDALTNSDEVKPDFDDSGWKRAFARGYGEYEEGKKIIVRGIFNLTDFNEQTTITFYSKSLTENQSVYVNGKLLAKDLKRNDPNQVFVLDHNILRKGNNVVALEGKPFVKRNQWEEINTNPGSVKVFNPAPQWKRKTFNGLAQIIVRTSKSAGEISLTATSEGLMPTTLKINSNATISKPSLE